MKKLLKVHEIFNSISGEVCSFGQGRRTTFIRFSKCNLFCSYCDSVHTQTNRNGKDMSISEIIKEVQELNCHYIIITGGEPLLQENLNELIEELYCEGYIVNVETNGTIHPDFHLNDANWIVDYKLQYETQMEFKFDKLQQNDFIKFVVQTPLQVIQAIRIQKRFEEKWINKMSTPSFAYSIATKDNKKLLAPIELLRALQGHKLDAIINVQIHKLLKLQ